MSRTLVAGLGMAVVVGLAVGSCTGRDEPDPAGELQEGTPAGQQTQGMQDRGSMQRHAQELDDMIGAMRQHMEQTRQLSAEQQHERMEAHVRQVSGLLNLVNRQMREMDMGMGMSDEQMGQMMGMSGEEHRRMMNEVEALRADVEQLQTASQAEVRDRMPAHLDRLERTTQMLQESADAMRRM